MKLFLSAPFSSRIDADDAVEADYRCNIEQLLAGLRQRGHEVYCALEYSAWKMGGLTPPEEEFRHDFKQIDSADKMIVLLEERVSSGVQLEMGYAYARGKRLEVYQIGTPAWTNETFAKVNGHEIIPVASVDDFVQRALSRN